MGSAFSSTSGSPRDEARRPADLWLFEFDTEEVRRLTWDDGADERQPWFSPDGRRVACARYLWYPDQWFYGASQIMVVDVH